ncbi:hypothetical protein NPIL_20201 [Nephila pilipes]|uniref:Uncharacterized protein n=1 Tax=Nephila pilipes TaxID=299642 RepID=A0A8X6NPK4_NEPPI|nr:hypothetical protein NPIL_20201 [Nephila pilipes]
MFPMCYLCYLIREWGYEATGTVCADISNNRDKPTARIPFFAKDIPCLEVSPVELNNSSCRTSSISVMFSTEEPCRETETSDHREEGQDLDAKEKKRLNSP